VRKNWCVICGAVRNRDTLLETLIHHVKLRDAGFIDGIVLSTWYNEIDAHDGLRQLLEKLDIGTVETLDPGMDRGGNFARQTKQLKLGLELCPENAYVLKTRTDLNLTKDLNTDIFSVDLTPNSDQYLGFPALFEKKIFINEAYLLAPFFITDFEFYGQRNDLYRLLDLNNMLWFRNTCTRNDWPPEHRLFGTPFVTEFNIFSAYYRRAIEPIRMNLPGVRVFRHGTLTPEATQASYSIVNLLTSDSFSVDVLMTWWAILDRYFLIGLTDSFASKGKTTTDREALRDVSVMKILDPATSVELGLPNDTGKADNFFIRGVNHGWLGAFVNNEMADDVVTRRLRQSYQKVSNYDFHQSYKDEIGCIDEIANKFFAKLQGIIGQQLPFAVMRKPGGQYTAV